MLNRTLLIAFGIIIGATTTGAYGAELGTRSTPGFGSSASSAGDSDAGGSSSSRTNTAASRGSGQLTGAQGGGSFPGGGGSPIPVTPIPGHIVQTQVQTSYETAVSAGGEDKSQMDVKPVQYNTGPANIPQILGPVQTNHNHPNAKELVTQTRVIFAGGQAVKVTQPLVTEYNWGPSESGLASRSSSYARVIKHEKTKSTKKK